MTPGKKTRGLFFAMRKLIIYIIVIAFAVNSAGQGHALRPMAVVVSGQRAGLSPEQEKIERDEVESDSAKSTTFTIKLPKVKPSSAGKEKTTLSDLLQKAKPGSGKVRFPVEVMDKSYFIEIEPLSTETWFYLYSDTGNMIGYIYFRKEGMTARKIADFGGIKIVKAFQGNDLAKLLFYIYFKYLRIHKYDPSVDSLTTDDQHSLKLYSKAMNEYFLGGYGMISLSVTTREAKKKDLNPKPSSTGINSESVTYYRLGKSSWYKELNAYLADMTGIHSEERILEIGAGPGTSTTVLLDKIDHQGKIIALEPNSEYLNIAAEALKDKPVEFILSNVQEANNMIRDKLPVDRVFLFNAIHVIKGHEALFNDLFAIIRPGGTLAFNTTYFQENHSGFRKMQRRIFVKLLRNTRAMGKDITTKDRARLQMRSIKDYEKALKGTGFEIVALEHKTVKIPLQDVVNFYRDKSVTDYIAPLLTHKEREELIMRLVMDEINLARDKGRDHIEGEWLFIVAKNLKGKNKTALSTGSKMLLPKVLFAEQRCIRTILQAA